ncbi:MAG: hypothetical protein QE285_20025 [Aquabacterium sp.]|nr:hypothetical protein [Aquabacterium sp.]
MRQALKFLLSALFVYALPVHAAEPPARNELDALSLADGATATQDKPIGPWRIYLEGAGVSSRYHAPNESAGALRGSLDMRFDKTLAPGLRLVGSNRLDLVHDQAARPVKSVNTLREAYLSWSRTDSQSYDFGRVNVRHGVALGYNPTDWFKESALRGVVSPDPAALRENRQGSVVLQGQQLWPGGGITLTLSPRIERDDNRDPGTFSLDLGATNPRHRWLLAGSWRVAEGLTPQVLVHGSEGAAPQFGLNLSALANDAVVVFGEAAFGRGPALASRVQQGAADERRQRRAAFGLTYTSPFNVTVTVEADYNSAAPNRAQWHSLRSSAPSAALQVLGTAANLQDLPARRAYFVYATWKDAFVRRLDLSAFVRHELETNSRAQWIELRHRWDRADVSLQLLLNSGNADSVYRAGPLRHAVEAAVRWYL